jgi:PAS domain S-box-containing protein
MDETAGECRMRREGIVFGRWRFAVLMAAALILLGALTTAWRIRGVDAEIREHLLLQATEIAGTLDPVLVRQLSFTATDRGTYPFETLRQQFTAYGRCICPCSIYTMALRDGKIVFGPENLAEDDPLASPPGTVFLQPNAAVFSCMEKGGAVVIGPATDEYGTFVSGLAPVVDPVTGKTLMLVGIDLRVETWRGRLNAVALAPLGWALALMAMLVVGTILIRHRQTRSAAPGRYWGHVEAATTAVLGLALTAAAVLLIHEVESRQQRLLLHRRIGLKAEMLKDEVRSLQSLVGATARFFESSDYVDQREFHHFADVLSSPEHVRWLAWAPRIPATEKAAWMEVARREGVADFSIWEVNASGEKALAAAADEWLPILFISPDAPETTAMRGMNLLSGGSRREMLRYALATRSMVALPMPRLKSAGIGDDELLVLLPVMTETGGQPGAATPAMSERGFVAGSINLSRLLDVVLRHQDRLSSVVEVCMMDPALFVAQDSGNAFPGIGKSFHHFIYPLFVFGRSYAVVAHLKPGYGYAYGMRGGWLAGGFGVLLTVALTVLVAVLRSRQDVLAVQVRERTAELVAEHERLMSANQMLQLIIDTIPVRLFWKDRDSRYLGCNRLFSLDAGRDSPADLIGDVDENMVWREHAEQYRRDDAAVMASGEPKLGYEEPQVTPDGRRIWLRTTKVPLHDVDHNIIGILGAYEDITERKQAEAALRENEARIRSLSNNLNSGMLYQVVRKPDGARCFTYLSDSVRRLYGVSPQEAMTDPSLIYGRVHEDDRARLHDEEEKARLALTSLRTEVRMMAPAGGIRWSCFVSTPTLLEDGSTRWDGIEFDISEQKKTEAALRENQRQMDTLMANLPGMAYRCRDDRDRTMEFVSKGCQALTGYAASDLIDDAAVSFMDLVHPYDREYVRQNVRQQLDRRMPFYLVYRMVPCGGGEKFVWEQGVGVYEDGHVVAIEGFIADITDRRRAEEKLEAEHAQMLSIFEAVGSSIYVADMDTHRILYANHTAREAFGENLVGRLCHEVIQGLAVPCSFCTNEQIKALAPQPYVWEFHNSNVNRTYRLVDRVIRWPDGRDVRFEMATDITDLKRAERERLEMERQLLHAQKLESLGVMAGGIAHDFNNLLMVILGNMELALMQLPTTSPAREQLDDAVLGARRAAELTRHMLDYAGRGRHEIKAVRINDVVRDNASILKAVIARNVELHLNLADDLPQIMADPGQLQQIVMNLVINASEAIGKGPGIVSISTGIGLFGLAELRQSRLDEKPNPGRFAWLEVTDSGCGMDESTLSRLFDPFFTTKFTGRGLGMAAVLGIVRGHRGAIFVDSKIAVGSTLRVLLPAADVPVEFDESAGDEGAVAHPSLVFHGGILVVDDEDMLRRICADMLANLGYRAFTAADGKEAIQVLRDDHAGLITGAIIDLTMPGMDGIATFAELRRIRPELRALLSSGFNERDVARFRAGSDWSGFIHKPFSMSDLRISLDKFSRNG